MFAFGAGHLVTGQAFLVPGRLAARPLWELSRQVPTKSATAKTTAPAPDTLAADALPAKPHTNAKSSGPKAASGEKPAVVRPAAPKAAAAKLAAVKPAPAKATVTALPAATTSRAEEAPEPVAQVAQPAPSAPLADDEEPAAEMALADRVPALKEEDIDPDEEEEEEAPSPAIRTRAPGESIPGHMMGRSQAIAPGGRVMPPPRAMAKAEIFEEGDHVVYPTHGVGKVERIATEEIAGHKLELIHITFEENRMTLRVPVAKARTAGLRKLATRKMFDEALAVLRGRARIKRTMWSRRAQEYEAKINSGDPLAIAEVVRDLHRNAGQPDQSFSERQIYEAAMDRLAAELGALDRIDKAAAAVKLAEFLKTVA
jgi:CarD family transcriptional regulator